MATGDATNGPHRDHIAVEERRNWWQRLERRARAEWLADAEEQWRQRTGRTMSAEELERALRRYPGKM